MIAFLALLVAMSLSLKAPEAETKVVGFEYAFSVPAELPAGRRAFRFENRRTRQVVALGPGD
ncbi:MAG: hypothetical protein M3Z05_13895 [Gemmatimonadota bacterium]|nr:hypothetical protein [Gemmatimonadota bacterium]